MSASDILIGCFVMVLICYLIVGMVFTSFRPWPASIASHVKAILLWLPAIYNDRIFNYIDE